MAQKKVLNIFYLPAEGPIDERLPSAFPPRDILEFLSGPIDTRLGPDPREFNEDMLKGPKVVLLELILVI